MMITFVCLGAAFWQWVELADRLHHLGRLLFKFGTHSNLISAGSFMVVVFFTATAVFVGLGLVAATQLRRAGSGLRFWSLLSVLMLVTGALVWGSLLASPLIEIVAR
ncbi:MAG: hypothetical protein AB1705_19745 [Verrucomicrobiota bacterium]